MLESHLEDGLNGFGREPLATMIRVEHPADFGLSMLAVSEPQGDIADWEAIMFDHQGQGAARGAEAGSFKSLGEFRVGVFDRPRVIEQVSGDLGT